MAKKIHQFETTFEEQADLGFEIERIEYDPESEYNAYQVHPHCHDFYYIMLVTGGEGTHFIDCETHQAENNTVFFVTPGQCHAFNSKQLTGYALSFKIDFYHFNKSINKIYEFPFFHTELSSPRLEIPKENTRITSLFESIYEESHSDAFGKRSILRSSLEILLLELTRLYGSDYIEDPSSGQLDTSRIRKLETLIDQHFVEQRHVDFYADQLNVSSRHLNNIVKNGIGKSINDMIQTRVLLEAKRRLLYTEDSVSEIAWKLNFSDKSYLHRLFKTHTRFTPEGFRKEFLKVH